MIHAPDPALLFEALSKMPGAASTLDITVDYAGGDPIGRMTIGEQHQGAPGVCHGGVLAALLDAALGARAVAHAMARGLTASTVELKTNFLRPARVGQAVEATTTLVSAGRSLLVVSGVVRAQETDEQLAFAVGTFNLYPLAPAQRAAMVEAMRRTA